MNDEHTTLPNRKLRRKWAKKHTPIPLIDMGKCAFCKETVWAGEGQSVTYMRETLRATADGETEQRTFKDVSMPTHKACRKTAHVDVV